MKINLHIDRLVLNGLPLGPHDGPLVQAAVESELARLVAVNGLADSLRPGGAMPSVRAPRIQMANARNATGLGEQIGRAVYEGIGNSK